MPAIWSVLLRLGLCLAITVPAYRAAGPIALVLCAPLFGIAFAAPLLGGLGRLPWLARLARYRGFHGRYHAFRGRQVVVHEDDEGHRWIELGLVRALDPHFPPDARLALLHPEAFRRGADAASSRLRAEELHALLRHARTPEAIRFRLWVERQVIVPARGARARRRGAGAAR